MKRSITIVGPTASGKTHRAVCIAKEIGGQIISADSRQVYRGMDLGTGKDLDEYEDVLPMQEISIICIAICKISMRCMTVLS